MNYSEGIFAELENQIETQVLEIFGSIYYIYGGYTKYDGTSFFLRKIKRKPFPNSYLLFEAECVYTTESIYHKDEKYPSVGDVCGTTDREIVKIVKLK